MIKVFERVIKQQVRKQAGISELQFRFMPGRGTIDAIIYWRTTATEIRWKEEKPLPSHIWKNSSIEFLGAL